MTIQDLDSTAYMKLAIYFHRQINGGSELQCCYYQAFCLLLQVIADTLSTQPVDVGLATDDSESLKRTLQRHKRGNRLPEPALFAKLEIDDEWASE